jgi:hypothetical protein
MAAVVVRGNMRQQLGHSSGVSEFGERDQVRYGEGRRCLTGRSDQFGHVRDVGDRGGRSDRSRGGRARRGWTGAIRQ